MNIHNYLYLIWKNPESRRNYIVGKLGRTDSGYTFEYCNEYQEATESGWLKIQSFPNIERYESKELFSVFSSRLPDRKRRGIEDILKKYGLDHYDGFELLKRSGGRLPIDTFEFIDPIFDDDQTIEREMFVVGIRHFSDCEGKDCYKLPKIEVGTRFLLLQEPTNEYDAYAVKVLTKDHNIIGYIPRYYSQSVSDRLSKGMSYDCEVIEINEDKNCQECVKIRLKMPKN